MLIITLLITSCAASNLSKTYDGREIIMSIPKGEERMWVDFYKCDMNLTYAQRNTEELFNYKICKMEE